MYKDRDMTYGELVGLIDRLICLGVLDEDDVLMRFIQEPNADFACPFLYAMRAKRIQEIILQDDPNIPVEDIVQFAKNSSVKAVVELIRSKHADNMDEIIGLLDFKNESKPEKEKFGGYLTQAGILHHELYKRNKVGFIDGPEETNTAVFGFKIFNGKWIPVIAKLPTDSDGVRTIKIPADIREKLEAYTRRLNVGEIMKTSLSSMDPDVVEFLEIARNPHLYEHQDEFQS